MCLPSHAQVDVSFGNLERGEVLVAGSQQWNHEYFSAVFHNVVRL